MDKEDVVDIYILYKYGQRNITQQKKKKHLHLTICNNMDKSRGYYSKWNTSDGERKTLYDVTYM